MSAEAPQPQPARMEVRIRLHQLTLSWLEAVADLLAEIDGADPALITDGVRERAAQVRDVMYAQAVAE